MQLLSQTWIKKEALLTQSDVLMYTQKQIYYTKIVALADV